MEHACILEIGALTKIESGVLDERVDMSSDCT